MSYRIDDKGTVLLDGHTIPVPNTISTEAQDYLSQNLWGTDAEAELLVFDAMPHTHWYALHQPETHEALDAMVAFFLARLG